MQKQRSRCLEAGWVLGGSRKPRRCVRGGGSLGGGGGKSTHVRGCYEFFTGTEFRRVTKNGFSSCAFRLRSTHPRIYKLRSKNVDSAHYERSWMELTGRYQVPGPVGLRLTCMTLGVTSSLWASVSLSSERKTVPLPGPFQT